jgi:hypothetical protein
MLEEDKLQPNQEKFNIPNRTISVRKYYEIKSRKIKKPKMKNENIKRKKSTC